MVTFERYTDDELRTAAKTLKARIKPGDFPVLEQIERVARKRGLDPSGSDFGPDVIGDVIRKMAKVK